MDKYNVSGMSCAACSATVEKSAKKVRGVESCSVSLLTNTMVVKGEYDKDALKEEIRKAGYDVLEYSESENNSEKNNTQIDEETKKLRKRIISSCVFLLMLMYTAMGHNMLSLPLPVFMEHNPIFIALTQLVLCVVVMVINKKFFINGFRSFYRKNPNMDTLVALGSSVSFLYSVGIVIVMAFNLENSHSYLHGLYFESAAMILVLISVGKLLESISKGKTTDALMGLMKLAPKTVTLLIDGVESVCPVENVKVGDIFVVRPGESIAVDGVVTDGITSVDESALTGESIPVDKEIGDNVTSGTHNLSGFITCKATRVGEDTTLSQIINMVKDVSSTKAPIARVADKVSGVFVPIVISLSILTLIIWLILGRTFSFALVNAISVLVISCPCALGLATPVAIMVGNGVGARNGILFKTAESLENMGKIKTVVFDKTGTLTKGQPFITDIISFDRATEQELISLAYSLEAKSEHPLAKAVVNYALENGVEKKEVTDFKIFPGNGLYAKLDEKSVYGGNFKFIKGVTDVNDDAIKCGDKLSEEGKTPLYFAFDGKLYGIIAVADMLKEDSVEAVLKLKKMGIHTVMLTGDNHKSASNIAKNVGIDEVISEVLPDGKEEVIRKLQTDGMVAMVGDGINDALALTRADVGIAIGAGNDIAIDSADIVLVKSRLFDVYSTIKISRATLTNIYENLFWAFIYNIIGIPLAAGAFISLLGWRMTPAFGALAMSLSSFCVVSNALRLNLIKLEKYNGKDDNSDKQIVMSVKGMMCEHCENRVEKVLREVDGVKYAMADYKSGKVKIGLDFDVDTELLRQVVEKESYKVKKIDR